MNPLAQIAGRQAANNLPIGKMLQQFAEFKKTWTPATAQAKINEMLENGQINSAQLEQAKQMANQMHGLLK